MEPLSKIACKAKSLGIYISHLSWKLLHIAIHLFSGVFDLLPKIRILIKNLHFKSHFSSYKSLFERKLYMQPKMPAYQTVRS
jgi:hypothetical protein